MNLEIKPLFRWCRDVEPEHHADFIEDTFRDVIGYQRASIAVMAITVAEKSIFDTFIAVATGKDGVPIYHAEYSPLVGISKVRSI